MPPLLIEHTDHFRAMDTDIDVSIYALDRPFAAFASVRLLFERQEERFSRFRASSVLSRLNGGELIHDATFAAACRNAFAAFDFTGGIFNPMILPALEEAGYDRTFDAVGARGNLAGRLVPGLRDCLSVDGDEVRLRSGNLDLGGIVKGWTVDLAIELLSPEYAAVLVNAGGDMRVLGAEEGVDGWQAGVASPAGGLAWTGVIRDALATSTVLHRRWNTAAGQSAHHLIDPRTGLPADSPFVQVSVRASETWRAEVWAKAVLIGGHAALESARIGGASVLAVEANGAVHGWT